MIEKLRVDYDQYFARVTKREPAKLREDIDRLVRTLSTSVINNTGIKFRLNTLVAKYNSYKQHWNKVLKMIEDGVYDEARARIMGGPKPGVPAPSAETPKAAAARPAAGGGDEAIFKAFLDAKKQCNEGVAGMDYNQFKKSLDAQREKLKSTGVTNAEFKVTVKDGKAKIVFTKK